MLLERILREIYFCFSLNVALLFLKIGRAGLVKVNPKNFSYSSSLSFHGGGLSMLLRENAL